MQGEAGNKAGGGGGEAHQAHGQVATGGQQVGQHSHKPAQAHQVHQHNTCKYVYVVFSSSVTKNINKK